MLAPFVLRRCARVPARSLGCRMQARNIPGGSGLAGQFNAPFTNSSPVKAGNGIAASLFQDYATATSPARRLNTARLRIRRFACFLGKHNFEATPTKERSLSISYPTTRPTHIPSRPDGTNACVAVCNLSQEDVSRPSNRPKGGIYHDKRTISGLRRAPAHAHGS